MLGVADGAFLARVERGRADRRYGFNHHLAGGDGDESAEDEDQQAKNESALG